MHLSQSTNGLFCLDGACWTGTSPARARRHGDCVVADMHAAIH